LRHHTYCLYAEILKNSYGIWYTKVDRGIVAFPLTNWSIEMPRMKKAVAAADTATAAPKVRRTRTPKPAAPGMSFGAAIAAAKDGKKIARAGWNGKGMWVMYVPGQTKVELQEGTPYKNVMGKRKSVEILPHFDMFTADKKMQPGWLASQSDMDATDWMVVK
jgi:hypothetical protein